MLYKLYFSSSWIKSHDAAATCWNVAFSTFSKFFGAKRKFLYFLWYIISHCSTLDHLHIIIELLLGSSSPFVRYGRVHFCIVWISWALLFWFLDKKVISGLVYNIRLIREREEGTMASALLSLPLPSARSKHFRSSILRVFFFVCVAFWGLAEFTRVVEFWLDGNLETLIRINCEFWGWRN